MRCSAVYQTNEAPSVSSFSKLNDVYSYQASGFIKFVAGRYSELSEAITRQKNMRKAGYSDAFVVAFLGSKRISIKEALSRL